MTTTKSRIWDYFNIKPDNKQIALCTIIGCQQQEVNRGGEDPDNWGTTNMRKHIKRHHKLEDAILEKIEKDQDQKKALQQENKQNQPKITSKFKLIEKKLEVYDQKKEEEITRLISRMIIKDMQPYSFVADTGFAELIDFLEPLYQIPSRTYFSKTYIPSIYQRVKSSIKKHLEEQCTVLSLTTDGWTGDNGSSFLSLTAHFLSDSFDRQEILLNLEPLNASHTSEAIQSVIKTCLENWGIAYEKVQCIIHDNAANMTSSFSNVFPQIFCSAHTLQLAIKDSIEGVKSEGIQPSEEILSLIEDVKIVVSHYNQSYIARNIFLNQSKEDEIKGFLIQDCKTRWNSTFLMLERFHKQKEVINLTLNQTKCKISQITEEMWQRIQQIIQILRSFKELSDTFESDKSSISQVLPGIKHLFSKLNKLTFQDTIIEQFKQTLIKRVESRFSKIEYNQYYLISTILDPRYKNKNFLNEKYIQLGFEAVNKEGYDRISKNKLIINEICSSNQMQRKFKKSLMSNQFWEDLDSLQINDDKSQLNEIKERIQTELLVYTSESRISQQSDPCEYWKEFSTKYPCLSYLARQFLWIPCTSAFSERTFSTAGNILSIKRSSLIDENLQMLCFLNKNFQFV